MEIKTLVAKAHENAVKHGFWEPPLAFGTAIALIHSCKYRSRKPEGVAVELADAVIRIADLCGHLGIDLEEVIEIKMAYNEGRPYKHGKKF